MPAPSSSFDTSKPPSWDETEPFEAPEAPRWEDTSPVGSEDSPRFQMIDDAPRFPEERAYRNFQAEKALGINHNKGGLDLAEPAVPPEAFKFLMEHTPNAYTLSKFLPVPESVREGMEGFKDTLAEGIAGMTSPESMATLPAFAVPYVGPALAMGMGAKSIGEGAGKTVAAIEQGNPRDIGAGLGEVGFGASMVVPGAMHSLRKPLGETPSLPEPIDVESTIKPMPEAPPIVTESIAQGEQLGLTKSVEALKATEQGQANASTEIKPAAESPKTRLDLILDEVEKSGEVTVRLEDGATREQVDKVVSSAESRGMVASFDGSGFLIRKAIPSESIAPLKTASESRKAATEKTTEQLRAELAQVTKEISELPKPKTIQDLDAQAPLKQRGSFLREALEIQEKKKTELPAESGQLVERSEPLTEPQPREVKTAETPPQAQAKMQAEVSSVAKNEGARPAKEIKSELVTKLEAAMAKAPETGGKKITISIPGDGDFTMWNTKPDIARVLQRAKKLSVKSNSAGERPARREFQSNNYKKFEFSDWTDPAVVPALEAGLKKNPALYGVLEDAKKIAEQPGDIPKAEVNTGALGESGMGGAKPGERGKAALAGMTDALKSLAESKKGSATEAFDLGKTVAEAKDRVSSAVEGLRAAGEYAKMKLEGKPVVTDWHSTLGQRHLELSESAVNARKFAKEATKAIPDKLTRDAISDWMDTGGDDALLARAAAETKPGYKAGYELARKLNPEQRTIAENLRNYFERRLDEAQKAGILEDGIENFIHRLYEKDTPFKKAVVAELRSGLFTGDPTLAKKRVFEYDFEAEKAGLRPIKDFVKRVAAYDLALNKAIADRRAVKSMMEIKMPDGRPMIDVGGGGKVIKTPSGDTEATLINRSAKKIDETNPKANRGDYKSYDHPALRKWKWVAEDAQGKPIFVQGDVLIHPDALRPMEKLLGRSRIRENPIGRAALNLSSTVKQTMLDLSGFHQVQIAVHGMEHRTFKPVEEIDFTNPDVRGLIKGGAVVGETTGQHLFSEGLSGSSLTKHVPWLGERVQAYQSYLFEDFIPRVKVSMGLHALERNRTRFPKLSEPELYKMTAEQMNAAFGELNYEMLGRSKTMQDALRLVALAPDFLEARSRFVAQAFTKYGAEQRQALVLGAVTMFVFARIANKILDDEYHLEPKNWFNVVYKGKSYGLRTIQGDLIHMVTDPGKFANHRLNPVYGKPLLEFATGRDYFGRKRSTTDKLKDIAMTPVPISVRGLTSGRELSLLESFLNSFGFVTKRNSPASDISKLANEWREKNKVRPEPGEFIYDADKDPYRKIKLAAEYYDVPDVRSEIERAIGEGMTKPQIRKHFVLSANHRFTGSAANDRKFYDSLTDDQKDMYRKALAERKRIKETVDAALR